MMGVTEAIKTSLERIPRINHAFIYGPFAKKQDDPETDIDVMVIGGPDLNEMEEIISKVEEEVGSRIQITSYTLREFRVRSRAKEDLIWNALRGPTVMLIGDEKEMRVEGKR